MLILASDTSGKSISVALAESGRIIDEILEKTTMQHASSLLPAINDLLERNSLSLQDIDLFATTTGPGSFTGIRIGISAVMGLAYGTGKKVYGVSSLAALAAAVFAEDKVIVPVLDARGGRVYSGIYHQGVSLIAETPRNISDFLQDLSDKYPRIDEITFVGDGSPLISEYLKTVGPDNSLASFKDRIVFAPSEQNSISAGMVALLAQAAFERGETLLEAHELEATYGIESAAKRNLKNKGD
ncbi:MAG: tRNA (adenosine(37)-N6)-threonylcarbamoyltransferase complex dimerization subunit type 1 TsaB [Clostridiaceae bacterium]|nr:tRNA (adenosine(37)-N6)-threonylcarbamoyltransferase complex dimerization subunit type 1 TsaB [Clostridiaceae bacterium]HZJ90422.1 tRNA (adenosine(37)-N6)-threonylcarbamoyltransferase complex dimerization subunit type 1 TsaB [Oscillospiraceae bacterium]